MAKDRHIPWVLLGNVNATWCDLSYQETHVLWCSYSEASWEVRVSETASKVKINSEGGERATKESLLFGNCEEIRRKGIICHKKRGQFIGGQRKTSQLWNISSSCQIWSQRGRGVIGCKCYLSNQKELRFLVVWESIQKAKIIKINSKTKTIRREFRDKRIVQAKM